MSTAGSGTRCLKASGAGPQHCRHQGLSNTAVGGASAPGAPREPHVLAQMLKRHPRHRLAHSWKGLGASSVLVILGVRLFLLKA